MSAVIVGTGAILALLDEAYGEHPRLAEIVNESPDTCRTNPDHDPRPAPLPHPAPAAGGRILHDPPLRRLKLGAWMPGYVLPGAAVIRLMKTLSLGRASPPRPAARYIS